MQRVSSERWRFFSPALSRATLLTLLEAEQQARRELETKLAPRTQARENQ